MGSENTARVDWVDYAKGVCIVLVVMMHSTLGVEAALGREGWMHGLVEFATAVPDPGLLPDLGTVSRLASSIATGGPISTARFCISLISI